MLSVDMGESLVPVDEGDAIILEDDDSLQIGRQ